MSLKSTLRKNIGQALRQLSNEEIVVQSKLAAEKLRSLSVYQNSTKIAFYMHMDSGELQTGDMIINAFADGKRVFLPHIIPYTINESDAHPWFPHQKTHLQMLEMPSLASVQNLLPRGKYRLKEPETGFDPLSEPNSKLDLIVLPGVGFSTRLGRLGHGAGYYDAYINEHRSKTQSTPKLVGVGLSQQLVADDLLPMEPHDHPLDAVILGDDVYHSLRT